MTLVIAAVLIVGGLLAAALVAIGVPALFGLIAFDSATAAPSAATGIDAAAEHAEWLQKKGRHEGRIVLERGIARAFVIVGGAFWGVAVFAGLYSYGQSGIAWALLGAFVPFVATLATLVLGWYYERFTAMLLVLASVGVVYWGVAHSFEAGVWMLVGIALIGPMLTAATLFWMARGEQKALAVLLDARPALAQLVATSEVAA